MTGAYYQDESVTLYHGDSMQVLRTLPAQSVNCCVTSPPYFGLRDYGIEGQYGLEASPAEYVETMRALFAEVRRVLADDGTLWLNLGDSYTQSQGQFRSGHQGGSIAASQSTYHVDAGMRRTNYVEGLAPKNLLGVPWRVAFALQDDCWILRNAIIWNKPNAMPESVTDRLSTRYEHVFLFSKSKRYWFDLDPIREPLVFPDRYGHTFGGNKADELQTGSSARRTGGQYKDPGERAKKLGMGARHQDSGRDGVGVNMDGRNPGDVWEIATQPFSAAHFAVMPTALASRCIQAGCKPGGAVLDPFSGSGTTGLAAAKHGRRYIGIDLNAEYLDLSLRTRLAQAALNFEATP